MFRERFVTFLGNFRYFHVLIICLRYVSGTALLHRLYMRACMCVCIIDFVTYFNISFITFFKLLEIEV